MLDNLSIKIIAKLNTALSAKQINSKDIPALEKQLKTLKLIASLNRTTSKSGINKDITQLQSQLKILKISTGINKDIALSQAKSLTKQIEQQLSSAKITPTINVTNIEKQAETAGKVYSNTLSGHVQKFFDDIGRRIIQLSLYTRGIYQLISLVSKSVKELKEMDTLITEIGKVSDRSAVSLQNLGNSSFDTASKYAKGAAEYLESVRELSRAGYKQQADALAELSLLVQSAGDVAAETANQFLIATDKGYGLNGDVKKLTEVLNGLNSISNKNAVSFQQLADAEQDVASLAAQSNVEIDQLAAAIGTMSAVTQSEAGKVAKAFRAILLNVRQVSGEVGDGEDIIDTTSLNKFEKACMDVGVALKEVKDGVWTLRDPMVVLEELSQSFQKLDNNSIAKNNLLSAVGGKLRSNQLSALLSNWDMYQKMLGDYANSENSAYTEMLKTYDSWDGRITRLSNTWTEFVSGFVNTDFMKGSVTGIEGTVSALDKLNQAGLFIPTLTGSITSLYAALNKDNGITQVVNSATGKIDVRGNMFGIDFTAIAKQKEHLSQAQRAIDLYNQSTSNGFKYGSQWTNKIIEQNQCLKDYLTSTTSGTRTIGGYKQAMQQAGISTDALRLKTIALNAVIGFGVGLAVTMAISAMGKLLNMQKEAIESAQKAKDEYDALCDEITEINNQIAQTTSKLDELMSKGTLSIIEDEEKQRLIETNDELARQLRIKEALAKIAGKDAEDAAVNSYNKQKNQSLYDDADAGYDANGDPYVKLTISAEQHIQKLKELQAQKDKIESGYLSGSMSEKKYTSKISAIDKEYSVYETALGEIISSLQTVDQSLIGATDNGEGLKSEIESVLVLFDSFVNPNFKSDQFTKLFNATDFKESKQHLLDLAAQGKLTSEALSGAEFQNFIDDLDKLGISAEEAAAHINSLIQAQNVVAKTNFIDILNTQLESFKTLNTEIDSLQSAYKTLHSAVDEYNTTGRLTVDSMQSIIALGDQYIGMLFDENGQLKLNKDAFIALANAKLDEAEATALNNAFDNISKLENEAKATDYLTGKTDEATTAITNKTQAQLESLAVEKMAAGGNIAKATQQIIDTFNQYKTVIDLTRVGLNDYTDSTMGATDATKALEEVQKALESRLKAQANAYIKAIDNRIEKLEEAKDAQSEYYDKLIDDIKAQKDALRETAEEEDKLLSLEKARANWENLQRQKTALIYKAGQGWVQDVNQEEVDKAKEEYDKLQKEYDRYQLEKELDAKIKKYEEAKEKALAALDDEINGWKDLKSQVQEQMSHIGETYDEHKLEMELLAEASAMSFDEMSKAAASWADAVEDAVRRNNAAMANAKGGGGGSTSDVSDAADKNLKAALELAKKAKSESTLALKEKQMNKLDRFASGTMAYGINAIVDDGSGKELIMRRPSRGRYTSLDYGDTVYPAQKSINLLKWAMSTPSAFASNVAANIMNATRAMQGMDYGAPTHSESSVFNINGNLEFPNVHDGKDVQSIVDEIKRLPLNARQFALSTKFKDSMQ